MATSIPPPGWTSPADFDRALEDLHHRLALEDDLLRVVVAVTVGRLGAGRWEMQAPACKTAVAPKCVVQWSLARCDERRAPGNNRLQLQAASRWLLQHHGPLHLVHKFPSPPPLQPTHTWPCSICNVVMPGWSCLHVGVRSAGRVAVSASGAQP